MFVFRAVRRLDAQVKLSVSTRKAFERFGRARRHIESVRPKLLASACLPLLAACQPSLDDTVRPTQFYKTSATNTGCLKAAIPVMIQFTHGKAQSGDVGAAWDCFAGALEMFAANTQGADGDAYTGSELRAFLEKHFLADLKISDAMLVETMRLKQSFLGGSKDRITRTELERAQGVLKVFKREALRVLPHIPVLTLKISREEAQEDMARIETAMADVTSAIENVSLLMGQATNPYELSHFENLLREFDKVVERTSPWDGPEWLIERLPTVAAFKAFLLRPNGGSIAPSEWQEMLTAAGRLYTMYLRTHYLVMDRPKLRGDGLDHLTIIANDALSLLEFAVDAKPDKLVNYKLINKLIDELYQANVFQWKLSASTVKSVVRAVLEKVLNPPVTRTSFIYADSDTAIRVPINGLNHRNLSLLRVHALGWLEMQRLWREVSARAVADNPSLAGRPIPLSVVRTIWDQLQTPYRRPYEDFAFIFNRAVPVSYSPEGALVFNRNPKAHAIDQDGFDSLNWRLYLVRIVGYGYSSDPEAYKFKGIRKNEFKSFFDDARQLAVDLELIDSKDDSIWNSTFFESNLFMLTGDGNEWLSFSEGMDLVSYAFGGSATNSRFLQDLLDHCPHQERDAYGTPKVTAQCLRERLNKNFAGIYRFFPAWVSLVSRFSPKQREEFQRDFEIAGRRSGYSDELIEASSLTRLTMTIQYVESVFVRYDTDDDGFLNLKEGERIFPLLEGLLKDISGLKEPRAVFALFTYLMVYGHPPETTREKLHFHFLWRTDPEKWEVMKADRLQILRIIGNLKSRTLL